MVKVRLKSDNINPFGGLFSIFNQFDRSGLRQVIDSHLGRRGATKAAFTHGDVFASMFGSYLCGDCIENVMDIKPFWDKRESIRVCSSDVILRTLRNLSCENSISRIPFRLMRYMRNGYQGKGQTYLSRIGGCQKRNRGKLIS